MNENQQLRIELEALRKEFDTLKAAATIPYDIDQAFRTRLGAELSISTKGVDTEDQAVNEAGTGTYNVLKEPDGFMQVNVNGTIYYLPYFT